MDPAITRTDAYMEECERSMDGVEIALSDGTLCLVSPEDHAYISQWRWQPQKRLDTTYAARNHHKADGSRTRRAMHQDILEFMTGAQIGPDKVADHINGDGLDNRRCNLRVASRQQNNVNGRKRRGCSSPFKGVSKCGKRWKAKILVDDKSFYLGSYQNQEEAARAYDSAALHFFGEFAYPNFPGDVNPYLPYVPRQQTSKYKGVYWHRQRHKWVAFRSRGGRTVHLGIFETEEEAAERAMETKT